MEEIIKFIQSLFSNFGIRVNEDHIIGAIVGAILALFIQLITTLFKHFGKKIHRYTLNLINKIRFKNIFTLYDYSNIMYFSVYPPINIAYNERSRIECSVSDSKLFKFGIPNNIESIIKQIICKNENIQENSEEYKERYNYFKNRIEEGNFSDNNILDNIKDYNTTVINNLINDKTKLLEAKEKVFCEYLRKSSGFHFNGQMLSPYDFKISRDNNENETFDIELLKTDYYSYRIVQELNSEIKYKYGLLELLPKNKDELKEYFVKNFQRFIHLGFANATILHTLQDNRIIITRRSAHSSNNAGEEGLYFMSSNEAINMKDTNPNNRYVNLFSSVKRGLLEEIIGEGERRNDLISKIKKCYLTGAFLYLPNLSLDLCFYVSIDCSSQDIKDNYLYARDSRFETVNIINENAWSKKYGLPKFDKKEIIKFIQGTIKNNKPSLIWDEGALITLILSTLVER